MTLESIYIGLFFFMTSVALGNCRSSFHPYASIIRFVVTVGSSQLYIQLHTHIHTTTTGLTEGESERNASKRAIGASFFCLFEMMSDAGLSNCAWVVSSDRIQIVQKYSSATLLSKILSQDRWVSINLYYRRLFTRVYWTKGMFHGADKRIKILSVGKVPNVIFGISNHRVNGG